MLKTNPDEKGGAKSEVKETFVRDGENDEGWREGQEDDHETVKIVIVRCDAVHEG